MHNMLYVKCYLVVNVVKVEHLKTVEIGVWRLEIVKACGKGLFSRSER